jgi:hypothetical protein
MTVRCYVADETAIDGFKRLVEAFLGMPQGGNTGMPQGGNTGMPLARLGN